MTSRVVLGLGGCVDYEVRLTSVGLERLVVTHGITAGDLSLRPSVIEDERGLVVSVLTYLREGRGGEHFVASAAVLEEFAARFPREIALGGTSVRAGFTLDRLGLASTLHLVTLNEHFRRLLPARVDYVSSSSQDSVYPHLITQFDAGLRVRVGDVEVVAPSANRLIYVNDPANEELVLAGELGALLGQSRLFLVSGFNAMRSAALLAERLADLRQHLVQLPREAFVYYEDAAFHEPEFRAAVRESVLERVDVYGLNEDEMQHYLGRPVDLLSAPEVCAALRELHALIPAPVLVVHTKFWSAAVGVSAPSYRQALDAGMLMASVRYVHGDSFTDEQMDAVAGLPRRAESVSFVGELEATAALSGAVVRARPGWVLDVDVPTTVGLGDTFVGGFLSAVLRERAEQWTS
ncbi:ADP-dependent glucokinase/phosphofructokinase [Kineosporia succinea]|uniref:ADP-dependent phosphofructokinase/glucokinase n=1 Tax=Kineosporia succinea TaxID=84632 RepID=A0ABT9PC51_9ACTN|nr:ADP-dependent glucokinase/phosphofructokinase [Kineosporia succinea]MDP9829979.1 ADP-dependent phosphofructokinase/glucokinase [Kineosporia succinea]